MADKEGTKASQRVREGKNILGFIFHTGFTTFLRKFNFAVLFLFANQNQFNFKTTCRANRRENILQWLFAPTWNSEHSLTHSALAVAAPARGELTREASARGEEGTHWCP